TDCTEREISMSDRPRFTDGRAFSRSRIATWTLFSMLFCSIWVLIPSGLFASSVPAKSSNSTKKVSQPIQLQVLRADRPSRNMMGESQGEDGKGGRNLAPHRKGDFKVLRNPREHRLMRARAFNGDLRSLPQTFPVKAERPEREGPEPSP